MSGYAVKRIDEMDAAFRGAFKRARAELGASAFGIQVVDLPPNIEAYPEHDHEHDGQEEVFATMRGGGEIEIEGERHELSPDVLVRVGPEAKRKVWPGDEGIRLLIVGGVPGKAYEAPELTEVGGPDPMAA